MDCDPELWRYLRLNLILQTLALLLAGMLLDGGEMAQSVGFASAVYWAFNLMTLIRRRNPPTKMDMFLAKIGLLVSVPVGILMAPIFGWLRH